MGNSSSGKFFHWYRWAPTCPELRVLDAWALRVLMICPWSQDFIRVGTYIQVCLTPKLALYPLHYSCISPCLLIIHNLIWVLQIQGIPKILVLRDLWNTLYNSEKPEGMIRWSGVGRTVLSNLSLPFWNNKSSIKIIILYSYPEHKRNTNHIFHNQLGNKFIRQYRNWNGLSIPLTLFPPFSVNN